MYVLNKENIENAAISTLTDIWSQIDWSKVQKQRLVSIWDEFNHKVRASVMTTNKYEKFVSNLCKKMSVDSLKFKSIAEISNQDEKFKTEVLKVLRNNTAIIILKMRINKDIAKEQSNLKEDK